MPWGVMEHIDEDTGEETVHIVPFVRLDNSFDTREECEVFAKEREIADDSVTDEDGTIIGAHKGHTLSPECACKPKASESDPGMWIHNAAN